MVDIKRRLDGRCDVLARGLFSGERYRYARVGETPVTADSGLGFDPSGSDGSVLKGYRRKDNRLTRLNKNEDPHAGFEGFSFTVATVFLR